MKNVSVLSHGLLHSRSENIFQIKFIYRLYAAAYHLRYTLARCYLLPVHQPYSCFALWDIEV